MNKKSMPAITAATVQRRESYQDWRQRRNADETRRITRAHDAALHVMDVIDAISGPLPPTPSPMEKAVERIRMRPQPPAVLPPAPVIHQIARNAQPYLALMGGLLSFFAGLALGKAL